MFRSAGGRNVKEPEFNAASVAMFFEEGLRIWQL
jgi:hypothetical protein